MGIPISKQAIDREQAYIRSQTSPGDVGYGVTGDVLGSSISKLSDLVCCQKIYESIIEHFTGRQFDEASSAAVAIERALQRLRDISANDQVVEASKTTIQESFGVLASLDTGIAKKVADCVREQAQDYDDTGQEGSIKAWLQAFPGENG